MWEFLAAHPWWSLVYLVIICSTITICVMAISMGAHDRKPKGRGVAVRLPDINDDIH